MRLKICNYQNPHPSKSEQIPVTINHIIRDPNQTVYIIKINTHKQISVIVIIYIVCLVVLLPCIDDIHL